MKITDEEKIAKLRTHAKEMLENIFFVIEVEQQNLKTEFRKGCKITDLSIGNSFIIIHKDHPNYPDHFKEAKVKLVDKIKGEIGYFSMIWDEGDVVFDDFFILY